MGANVKGLGGWLLLYVLSVAGLAVASGDLRLADAVEKGDKEAARSLLKQQADVNTPQPDGATALAWAAHWDDLETAELLIRAGANVNAANDYGVTPLSLACTNRSAAMVKKLLEAGANPNLPLLRTGEIPLMTCARTGNVNAVKSLVAHGADVNAKETRRGQTVLMWAVAEKHLEVARALIEHGADVHARSKGGFTPLLFAARQGSVDLARILLAAGAIVNEAAPEDGSVLVVAAASSHEALSLFLLENGADPNAADSFGITALHYAVQKGLSDISFVTYTSYLLPPPNMPELVKALLAAGANPNARIVKDYPPHTRAPFRQTTPMSIVGGTPFFLAAAAGDASLIRVLAAGGADPLMATKENTTPLMVAAGMGRPQDFLEGEERSALEAVKLAVELGADVNAANVEGQTALHAAAFTGVNTMVQFLVDKGAEVDAKDKTGQTPWSIAEAISPVINRQGELRLHKSTANLLLKLGATPLTASDITPSAYPAGGGSDVVDDAETEKVPDPVTPRR